MAAQARFASSAATPMIPIVSASGSVPAVAIHTVLASTHSPRSSSDAPFASAARARHLSASPATPRLIA